MTLLLALLLTQTTVDCRTAPLSGTTYYYCDCASNILGGAPDAGCVAGNDANSPCTNPNAPCRTLSAANARFNAMAPGNTVALCKGGTWAAQDIDFNNSGCTAGAPCYFRSYSPPWGGASRPRMSSSGTILSNYNSNVGNYRVWGLDVRNPTGPGSANGIVIIYGTSPKNIDLCDLHVEGGWLGVYFEPTGRDPSGLQLRDSEVWWGCFAGFYGGAPGVTITGNHFLNNASAVRNSQCASQQNHSAYIVSTCPSVNYYSSTACGSGVQTSPPYDANTPTPFTFSNNRIENDSTCLGAMLDLHGVWVNTQPVIENNLVTTTSANPGCYGVTLSGGNTGAVVLGARVRRNRVHAPGNAINVSCCTNCDVSDNVATNGAMVISDDCCSWVGCTCPGGYMGAGNVTLRNNTVYPGGFRIGACGTGPYFPDSNAVVGGAFTTRQLGSGTNLGNYFSASVPGATACWVDPNNANPALKDFTPAAGSPLLGYGSSVNYSPIAIGSALWSATDAGLSRAPPIDAGAFNVASSSSSGGSSSSSGGSSSSSSSGGSSSSSSGASPTPSTRLHTGGSWFGVKAW